MAIAIWPAPVSRPGRVTGARIETVWVCVIFAAESVAPVA